MTTKIAFILSDGCFPTEELYFRRYISPRLKRNNIVSERYINCRLKQPDEVLSKLKSQDYLIYFRTLPANWALALTKFAKASDRLIYILDDDLAAAAKTPELPLKYKNRIGNFAEKFQNQLLNCASVVIVSSMYLMEQYRSYSPQLLQPTMLIDREKDSFEQAKTTSICYHATRSHEKDLIFLEQALNNVLVSKEISFESLIGSSTPKSLSKRKNVTVRQPKSWQSFKFFQRLAKRNIGLAPLLDTPYNRAKSHIKFLDYAAIGAVGIYSNREPYSLIVEHGVDGFLADDNTEEWQMHLEFLISNPDVAKTMARNAQNKAYAIGHPRHAYRFWRKLLAQN